MARTIVYDLHDSFDSDTYLDKSERNIQRVSNKLDDYIKVPNEENIHDIRKAVRRLEASYRALPSKKVRKKRVIREYTKYSKELFSLNSQIRDFDIIGEKLSSDAKPAQQDVIKSIEGSLFKQRKTKLNEAISFALELRKLHVPKLTKKIKISNKRSKKRFSKVIGRFATRIEHNLPLVANGDEKITELHDLRKDCKKLRYLLELLPDNNHKDTQRGEKDDYVSELMEKLENVQDILGIIHDHDTTIAYLKRHKGTRTRSTQIHSILTKINRERQNKYEEFVKFVNRDMSVDSNSFFTRITNVIA
ncbi:MAG: CHAD domain-containing protein [Nitrososphaeraceae archaeon]|nr:CHAD domain-containing protein [Nitrososphaeraceae archaeon]